MAGDPSLSPGRAHSQTPTGHPPFQVGGACQSLPVLLSSNLRHLQFTFCFSESFDEKETQSL